MCLRIKFLKRGVGAVASIDTHQRLATQVVQEKMAQGVLPHINEGAQSIVSVDNIDILQHLSHVQMQPKVGMGRLCNACNLFL